mmetsp:Transcript_31134/g.46418  ORF Transcript_31134/g.46418 Transcript_31134/m.46418 type:complete len:108 (-) Transcript_31134:71-394(-)
MVVEVEDEEVEEEGEKDQTRASQNFKGRLLEFVASAWNVPTGQLAEVVCFGEWEDRGQGRESPTERFRCSVCLRDMTFRSAWCRSKKEAEHDAARLALGSLEDPTNT